MLKKATAVLLSVITVFTLAALPVFASNTLYDGESWGRVEYDYFNFGIKDETKTVNYTDKVHIHVVVQNENTGANPGFKVVLYPGKVNNPIPVDSIVEEYSKDGKAILDYTSDSLIHDITYTVRIEDNSGNLYYNSKGDIYMANITVKVRTGFFQKILGFFKTRLGLVRTVNIPEYYY
jgi:hypothetical protein